MCTASKAEFVACAVCCLWLLGWKGPLKAMLVFIALCFALMLI